MWKKSKEFLNLRKKVNSLSTKDIIDVAVFGSAVKDKSEPNDIDIAIVFRNDVDRELLKKFQERLGEKFHISSLVADNFFTKPHSLAKTLLFEGMSLVSNKKLADAFGLNPFTLYTYELKKEDSSKKVRFVYLLKGRAKGEGIVDKFKGSYISPSSFIIPVGKDEEMLEIFKKWGVKFYRKKIMLMR